MRDATGKNIGEDTLVKLVQNGFQSGGYGNSKKTTLVSEIHYAPEHLALAKAVLPFVPSAQLVKDPSIDTGVLLVLGQFFPGLVVDPAAAATTLPPAPVDTAPVTTPLRRRPPRRCRPQARSAEPPTADSHGSTRMLVRCRSSSPVRPVSSARISSATG